MEFEWDIEKARSNQEKHGVSFGEACTVFSDDHSSTVLDPEHSKGEYDLSPSVYPTSDEV
jgi:uncharacterized DUF497 family protein